MWRSIAYVLDLLGTMLERLLSPVEREHVNPLIADIFRSIATDIDALLDEIADQRHHAQLELAPVAADAGQLGNAQ